MIVRLTTFATVAVLLVLAGCAAGSAAATTGGTGDGVPITVAHNAPGQGAVTIQLLGPTGRRFLGTVDAAATTTFRVSPAEAAPGEYLLVAQTPDGRTIESSSFFLREEGVTWRTATQTVFPGGR